MRAHRVARVLLAWTAACSGGGPPPPPVPCEAACFTGTWTSEEFSFDRYCRRTQDKADGTACGNGMTCRAGKCLFCNNQPDGTPCGPNALCVAAACTTNPYFSVTPVDDVGPHPFIHHPFGDVAVGATKQVVLAISTARPRDTVAIRGLAAPFSYAGGAYPGQGGTCGATIDRACRVVLSFDPADATIFREDPVFEYAPPDPGGFHSFTVPLAGRGRASAVPVSVTPAIADLGSVQPGSSAVFTVSNAGRDPCLLMKTQVDAMFRLDGVPASGSLGPGERWSLTVTVEPVVSLGLAGQRASLLSLGFWCGSGSVLDDVFVESEALAAMQP